MQILVDNLPIQAQYPNNEQLKLNIRLFCLTPH